MYIILYFISNDEEDVVDDGDRDAVAVAVAVASVASAAANTAVVSSSSSRPSVCSVVAYHSYNIFVINHHHHDYKAVSPDLHVDDDRVM